MIKRYIAKRNNPWELLLVAFVILSAGVSLVFTTEPVVALALAMRGGNRPILEALSPRGAHIIGWTAIACAALIVWFYFYVRRAIARDLEAGDTRSLE
jgi:hypothetical protein